MSDFGLVSWDSVEFNQRGGTNRKRDEFIKLQSGSNVLRVVSRPYQYNFHKWKEEGDKGYGDKVMCSMIHGSCPLCAKADRPKRRWYVGVIDRKTQSYKILDMSPAVFQAVQKLTRNELWGDPGHYDIDIVVDKNAGATGYYTVMPLPKQPLSDSDIEIKQKQVDTDSLQGRCNPPKPDGVERRLAALREEKNKPAQAGRTEPTTEAAVDAANATANTGGDDEYEFPPANVTA
jgi:hypothetical protein